MTEPVRALPRAWVAGLPEPGSKNGGLATTRIRRLVEGRWQAAAEIEPKHLGTNPIVVKIFCEQRGRCGIPLDAGALFDGLVMMERESDAPNARAEIDRETRLATSRRKCGQEQRVDIDPIPVQWLAEVNRPRKEGVFRDVPGAFAPRSHGVGTWNGRRPLKLTLVTLSGKMRASK